MTKTLYQILNVPESASDNQLQAAFSKIERQLIRRYDEEAVNRLNRVREAYGKLSNPTQRETYDRELLVRRHRDKHMTVTPKFNLLAAVRSPAILATLVVVCGLLVYWKLETQKIQLTENTRNTQQINRLLEVQQQVLQAGLERENRLDLADRDAEKESRRVEAELKLQRQVNEFNQSVAAQQLKYQALESAQNLQIREKQSNLDVNKQELEIARQKLELQAQKTTLSMQLKQQAAQNALLAEQRALLQHDANIQSIRELQAARLREYERTHYGTGGISRSNPAMD